MKKIFLVIYFVAAYTITTVLPPSTAIAQVCDAECRLFNGTSTLTPSQTTVYPVHVKRHAETSLVLWNGVYYLYYRTYISSSGVECTSPASPPQGIAVTTSSDGVSWTNVNSGRPIAALQTVQNNTDTCADQPSQNSSWVYAPDVIVDGNRLLMVFEQRDHIASSGVNTHSIRYVTSNDGLQWSSSTRLLNSNSSANAWDKEIGTPDIEKYAGGYVVTFHSNNSILQKLNRGYVTFPTLGQDIQSVRTKMTFKTKTGVVPSWLNYGVGMADMTLTAAGEWYMVMETFSGASAECNRTDTATYVSVAKSTNLTQWTVPDNPMIVGRLDSCGWDMPSWAKINNKLYIITTNDPSIDSVVSWEVTSVPAAPVRANLNSNTIRSNEYILRGDTLYSSNGLSRLSFQTDGNLVLYRNSDNFAIWASNTHNTSASMVIVQHDGNLVIKNGTTVFGHAGTWGRPGAALKVNSDTIDISLLGLKVWDRPFPTRGL